MPAADIPLAGPLGTKAGIEADHQPLAGKVGTGNLRNRIGKERHRTAIAGTQEAEGDLLPAGPAIPAVAECRQRAALTLKEARGHVVKHQRIATPQVPVGQAALDKGLAGAKCRFLN